MRRDVDEHFARPEDHGPAHQVWNYWHVPGIYTYLRTNAERVIAQGLVDDLHRRVSRWMIEHLGMADVTYPLLSLYVDGCRQGLHDDAENGRWGYVFSLTKWSGRRFFGGETLLLRPAPWSGSARPVAAAGTGLYDLIDPVFNQLLVFDDRLIHGVQTVEGSMDPADARIVLQGHAREGGVVADGALGGDVVLGVLGGARERISRQVADVEREVAGMVSVRLDVDSSGAVEDVVDLTNHLRRREGSRAQGAEQRFVSALCEALRSVVFPEAGGATRVYCPIVVEP
jgi:hypothetical protein